MTATRAPAPELQITGPSCPICMEEVSCDSTYYWCENCDIAWDLDGDGATWSEPEADQCPWLYTFYSTGEAQCILAAGHDSVRHMDAETWSWSEDDAGAHLPVVEDDPGDGKRVNVLLIAALPFALALPFARDIAQAFGWVA